MISKMPSLAEFKELINKDKRLRFLFSAFVVALVAIPGFLYTQSDQVKKPPESSQVLGTNSISLDQVNDIVKKVSKLADIPPEIPNIATINDASVLRSQPFFAKAENGDKVLIFQAAQRAILYRPLTNKIIEYSAISVAIESPTPSPQASSESLTPSQAAQPTIRFQKVTPTPTTIPTSVPVQ